MKQLFFILLCVPFFLLSCQKEFTPGDITLVNDSTINACDTYYPLAIGDTWTVADSTGLENTITVVEPDTVINGKTFKRLNQDISGQKAVTFSREENGFVYSYVNLDANVAATGQVLINPLRTNAAVGEKWNDAIVVNGFTENFEYEMLEKNISYSVNGLNFPDVIHVQYKVRLDAPPIVNNEVVQITDVWFARCVGGIRSKTSAFLSGIPAGELDYKIKSYTVK